MNINELDNTAKINRVINYMKANKIDTGVTMFLKDLADIEPYTLLSKVSDKYIEDYMYKVDRQDVVISFLLEFSYMYTDMVECIDDLVERLSTVSNKIITTTAVVDEELVNYLKIETIPAIKAILWVIRTHIHKFITNGESNGNQNG